MKLDMGRTWNDAMALLRGNRQVVLIVAGVFFFLPNLALMLLAPPALGQANTGARSAGEADVGQALQEATALYGEIWWQLLLVAVLTAIGMLGLLALLTDRRRPTVGEALKSGAGNLLPYVGSQLLLAFLVIAIVMVPIIVAGAAGPAAGVLVGLLAAVAVIYVYTKLSLITPVIMMDGIKNPVRVLGRSWALTKGNSVRLFFFFLLLLLALIVIVMTLGLAAGLIGFVLGEEGSLILNSLLDAAVNMATITLFLAVLAAVHRQLSGGASEARGETAD